MWTIGRLGMATPIGLQQGCELDCGQRALVAPPTGRTPIDSSHRAVPMLSTAAATSRCGPRACCAHRGRRVRAGTPSPAITPPSVSTNVAVAAAVPPVASTSSTIRIRSPGWMASRWISSLSEPYSSWYSSRTTAHGSLPGLRTGTNPAPIRYATAAPKMNPRDSTPTTRSTATPENSSTNPVHGVAKAAPSPSRGVMSRNVTPSLG